ncbi:PX domain-containing protein EREL2-like isoform X2 [Andrographis paniculata]|uniref:PX domain-containing protein EREL2-like isoform X2 n=1 Tax=Andrographis paniculata TaxID=175694 RepID=UPI0021E94FB9|nr:PX domain-containing protein EREL2-like isoform X2 [Andrographis paniculata]
MNLYGLDYTSIDLGLVEPGLVDYVSPSREMIVDRRNRDREVEDLLNLSNSLLRRSQREISPPQRRHDGTSPLPLGMDWSSPPGVWDGPNTTWPHDFHTGWTYCATIPGWSFLSESGGSEPGVFYRVKVGLQSPEGVTTSREVLRRFSDFLKLSSDLKQSYRKKKLPPPPSKGLFKLKSETALEERRNSLEDWMTKVLSDIDLSRSASVACFLELEAIARLSFRESSHDVQDLNLSCNGSSLSTVASIHGPRTEASEIGSEQHLKGDNSEFDNGLPDSLDDIGPNEALHKTDNANTSEVSSEGKNQFQTAVEQQLRSSKTDVEDLVARLTQERAVTQYLTIKINDLETELESTKKSVEENLERAMSAEEERITQMQCDMEELRKRCIEMELRLKSKQDEYDHDGTTTTASEEIESVREELRNLRKSHEEAQLKSKSEVESLRSELEKVAKERTELEAMLRKERAEREHVNDAHTKLLHECKLLRSRLEDEEFAVSNQESSNPKIDVDVHTSFENQIDPSC